MSDADDASQSSPDLEAANLLQSLSLDPQSNSHQISEPTNTLPASHVGTDDLNNAEYGQGQFHEESIDYTLQQGVEPAAYYQQGVEPAAYYQQGVEPAAYYQQGVEPAAYYQQGVEPAAYYQQGVEPSTYYQRVAHPPQGYYFPSNDGSTQYDGHAFHPGVYGVNAPVMYHQAYAYASYPTYTPDGLLYGSQQYQCPPPYLQPYDPYVPSQAVLSNSAIPIQYPSFSENASGPINSNAGGETGNNVAVGISPSGNNGPQHSDAQPQALTNTTTMSSMNQSAHPQSQLMGMYQPTTMSGVGPAQGYVNMMHSNEMYGQDFNTGTSGHGYDSNSFNARAYGRGSSYESGGLGNGNNNIDVSNELNWGQALPSNENEDKGDDNMRGFPGLEQYNLADFVVDYTDAKFFVIKSYSAENIHKSIKYKVWASTTIGNAKLDAAYREAQGKSGGCPIFLFFSVNSCGRFVGVAEMKSPVDFKKSVEYWQQKWYGVFSVKWHIVKNVPFSLLDHIILEENENKPVTRSRDNQEVTLEKGLQMLKVFKQHPSEKSILDDFWRYEFYERKMQEKRAKQQQPGKQNTIYRKFNEGTSRVRSEASAELNEESTGDSEVVGGIREEE